MTIQVQHSIMKSKKAQPHDQNSIIQVHQKYEQTNPTKALSYI
jgi:hypothetical protein